MARHAAWIAVNGAEFFVAASAVEARRLKTHRVEIRPGRPDLSRLILDRRDQLCAVVLAAEFLLDPEELDEQNLRPDLTDDAADDLAALFQGNREALVLLLSHPLIVVANEPGEHRFLGRPNAALGGDGWHGSAERHVDRRFRQLRI